jgi:hypothetical protein
MGYVLKHHRRDGSCEITVDDCKGNRQTFETTQPVAISNRFGKKSKPTRKVSYNFRRKFSGKPNSAAARNAEIRSELEGLRNSYTSNKGMTKGGTMKHVARIPPEIWYSEVAENGPGLANDKSRMMKVVDDFQLRVS